MEHEKKSINFYAIRIVKICILFFILTLLSVPVAMSKNNDFNSSAKSDKSEQMVYSQIEDIITSPDDYDGFEDAEDFAVFLPVEPEAARDIENTAIIGDITTIESEATQISATVLNGYHTQVYYNGDIYTGYFVDGVRSGQGTYTWENGIVYTGEWENGEPNGNGEYIYPTEPETEPENSVDFTEQFILIEESEETKETTETQTPPVPGHVSEIPDDNFMQVMFENAIEIPESEYKIEFPPEGRSLELQYSAVPLNDMVPEPFGYFKDIIFLGDSVTIGFDLYRSKIKFNGEAVLRDVTVIAVGSYGVYRSADEISDKSVHPLYKGEQALPEDIIAEKDAKYVFICLGLNDVAIMSSDNYIGYYSYLINRIKYKNPDKTVVIMSVTPLVFGGQKTRLNNKTIMDSNNILLQFAQENNIPFIDYAAAIRNSQNCLYDELSSDAYCHLTIEAYNRLVEYLLYHALQD